LIDELANEDAEVRENIAKAMERFRTKDVVHAMLDRILVEKDETVKFALVRFQGYSVERERAFPILVNVMKNDPSPGIRVWTAFLLEYFGKEAEAPLLEVLEDERYGIDRSAVMSLGKVGSLKCLPALTKRYGDPKCHWFERELEIAIVDVVVKAAYGEPPPTPKDYSQRIQGLIDASDPDPLQNFPAKPFKDRWNALSVWGTQLDHWGLQPDGTILVMDTDTFALHTEPEEAPLRRFAVMVHAAEQYPELTELIPQPPKNARPCKYCMARGWNPDESVGSTTCWTCHGLGWVEQAAR
jgi:hypothetical protein